MATRKRPSFAHSILPGETAEPLYPRSFFRFLVTAFALVTAPLLTCLIYFMFEANLLADRSEQTVRQVAWTTQDVQSLQQTVQQMERVLRQSIVLAEPPSLDAYDPLHDQIVQTAGRLLDTRLPEPVVSELRELLKQEAELGRRLTSGVTLSSLPSELLKMNRAMEALAGAGTAAAAQEIDSIQQSYFTAQQRTFYVLGVFIPLAISMAVFFTVLLAKPIRRIDEAIRRIGAGRLEDEIHIAGPQDVQLLGQRLNWLRRRLKELEADRALLSQSVSHDLKTPLTSIYEGLNLLQQGMAGALTPRQAEIVNIMRASAHSMAGKIENLLTVRSSALRDTPVELRPLELRQLISSVVSHHQLSVRTKELAVDIEGPELRINGDRSKLRIVVDNLLSNAIRFSPQEGRILFELSANDSRVRVAINDEGPGITEANASRIFDSGYRTPGQPQQAVAGSGVGLSVAREFILAHRGRIDVDTAGSRLRRRGARIVIELPVS